MTFMTFRTSSSTSRAATFSTFFTAAKLLAVALIVTLAIGQYTPPAGGGGIKTQTVTITDSQVLTLDTVPVTLVPAPGAGTVLFVEQFLWQIKGSATYSNGSANLNFLIGAQDILDTAILFAPGVPTFLLNDNVGSNSSIFHGATTNYLNQPFTVSSSAAVTGSGGGITVTTYYYAVKLP